MNPEPDDEKFATFVHRALRELPPRRAPASLEQAVLAELERRAALPWWRKSFIHWPVVVQAGFVTVSALLVLSTLLGRTWIIAGFVPMQFKAAFAGPVEWMEKGLVVIQAIAGFFEIMMRNIPPLWLYGGLVFFAAMYATLFGLGAAAFKALRTPSSPTSF